ncbi:glycosyltransferase family 4 protein [Clostridium perfringens]|uniref:glycosyltransferase family 4 protein n=1 Tax=Clostridium perfringens TaxID=1502 RepID=UPI0018E419CC|nr:glycosyltransferase family 4 protein [Clostridium perfringens]MBI6001571.1 glycosyltransferase family 4 protein [Clostridium perfringens]MDK0710438.1 glycosyltransferase family 4 protein [Clostridium perfringens]MDK0713313.1 glycosyltransferase family 4 protein [Clostridium perfringens]
MKVLYFTNIPSPYRVDFFSELALKCDLSVIYERNSASNRNKNWKTNGNGMYKEKCIDSLKLAKDKSLSFSIINEVKKQKYDVIVIGGYATPTSMILISYLSMKKIPFILNADGGFPNKKEAELVKKIKKYFISKASMYLSTGKITDEYLIEYGAKKNIIRNYNFTSLKENDIGENLECKKLRKELNLEGKKIILSVGRICFNKGFDTLIKASKYLVDNTIILIVGGKASVELENLIKEEEITNVFFIDFKSKDKLKEYFSIADIFVLPTRQDVWGLVINEAMANGLPVITTNKCIAGLELIENNINGFLFDVDNYKELANRINELLNNEDLIKTIKKNNLLKIKKYTIENMANQHLKIFKEFKDKFN